ncbi:MAG: hypothetical protein JSU57_05890 [Candidatus Heimdallarchaeota archaeon]|nr:MAG: hypothetical protein JSU57_05890 [Candidatus Heimdallarchaeota archaeon]
MKQLDIDDESEADLFVVYDLIINGGGLICSHCGKRFTVDELFEQKIVVGNEEGYVAHVDCLLGYIMKAEPIISSGLASGLFSESQVRHDLLSRPFESVILDISRACSYKRLSPSKQNQECSKFVAFESNLIEERNNYNLELLLTYLDSTLTNSTYSDLN